jgi:hypothetical protein
MHVSWAYNYRDFNELLSSSDLVAVGYVQDSKTIGDEKTYYLSTLYDFQITEVLHGKSDAQVIPIIQTGGINLSGKTIEVDDDPLMKKGDLLLLFLKKADTGYYFIQGGPQGRFVITEDGVYSIGEVTGKNLNTALNANGVSLADFKSMMS